MFGAPRRTRAPPDVSTMCGAEGARAMEAALLIGLGAVGAHLVRGDRKRGEANRNPLALYDVIEDRFEGADQTAEPIDLPSFGHSDQGAVDWIVIN